MDDERVVRALERACEALERAAAAQEHLNDLAAGERQTEAQDSAALAEQMFDAPACPHCGVLDPRTQTSPGDGKLSEFVLVSPCGNCGNTIYALPVGWRIVASKDQARDFLEGSDPLLRGEK